MSLAWYAGDEMQDEALLLILALSEVGTNPDPLKRPHTCPWHAHSSGHGCRARRQS